MTEEHDGNDGLNVPAIVIAGVVSVILVFAAIVGIQVLYFNVANAETDRKITQQPDLEADSAVAQQDAKLARFGWIDKSKATVAIPIERAMELVVRELQAKPAEPLDTAGRPPDERTQ